jgi:hypothetical protein
MKFAKITTNNQNMKILNFKDYVSEKELVKGGVADNMDVKQLADKHGVSDKEISDALAKGQKVELEHTGNSDLAYEIAKDHIFEDPKYYDKLAKIEAPKADKVQEANDNEYSPEAHAERLKRREAQNIQRYRAAQDRGDNFAIALYELKIKLDKIDFEKLKVLNAIEDLKEKFNKKDRN